MKKLMMYGVILGVMFAALPAAAAEKVPEKIAEAPSSPGKRALDLFLTQMSKIRFSGYVQARYDWHRDGVDGVDANGKPLQTSQFYIRRGRMKVIYDGQYAEAQFELDASQGGASLFEAHATLIEPWTPLHLRLTGGQFKVPLSFEILQSSRDREMLERSRVSRILVPRERDRGLMLSGSYRWFQLYLAVFNGNGITDSIYGGSDSNSLKDFAGRISAKHDFLNKKITVGAGFGGYYGRALKTTLGKAASLGGKDSNGDGQIRGDEIVLTPATVATYEAVNKHRVVGDVELGFVLPKVGKLSLKGMALWGEDLGHPVSGFYVLVTQELTPYLSVALRLDQFDTDTARAQTTITTPSVALVGHLSKNFNLTAAYERPLTTALKPLEADTFTLQLQAMF